MRRSLVPCAIVLALVTGVVLAETGHLLLSPAIANDIDRRASGNEQVIRRFYDAVNTTLETGDLGDVDDLLDRDLVDHAPHPGASADRDGFLRSLQLIHASDPTLRLTVLDVVAQNDRVMARVGTVSRGAVSFLDVPVSTERQWSPVDVFQLRSGRIVERWGDETGLALFDPMLSVTVPTARPMWGTVTLERWTYVPGAREQQATVQDFMVIFVESGGLNATLDERSLGEARLVSYGNIVDLDDRQTVLPGSSISVGPGDALIIPPLDDFELRNDVVSPSVALVIKLMDPTPMMLGSDTMMLDSDTISRRPTASPGVEHLVLAGGMTAILPTGGAKVAIGRAGLAPATELPAHKVGVVELVAVEAGSVDVRTAGGDAWIRSIPSHGMQGMEAVTLSSGGGSLVEAGTTVTYRSSGTDTLEMIMVTVSAARAE